MYTDLGAYQTIKYHLITHTSLTSIDLECVLRVVNLYHFHLQFTYKMQKFWNILNFLEFVHIFISFF